MSLKHKESNKLATQAAASVPALQMNRPDFLRQAGDRGLENVEQRDITLPRLGICQSLTPQRKPSSPSHIEGLAEGDFFNSVSGQIYPARLRFVPLLVGKSRLYFRDLADGGGLLCQSANGKTGGLLCSECEKCEFAKWSDKGEAPACLLLYNYVGVLLPARELIVVSLKTSGIKVAKQWNALMRLRNADTFAGIYELSTLALKNTAGEWHGLVVKPAGWVDKETYEHCEGLYNSLRRSSFQVDSTGLNEETGEIEEL